MDEKRRMLRHFLGAVAYRTRKALKDHPHDFGEFRAARGIRTPHQIVNHMTNVLGYARTFFVGGRFRAQKLPAFPEEIARLHETLADLSKHIAGGQFQGTTPERMLQGPLSDVMSHAGQLAMLRRLAGSPVPPENFIMADISAENVSPNQADPVSPDKHWYDAEDEPE